MYKYTYNLKNRDWYLLCSDIFYYFCSPLLSYHTKHILHCTVILCYTQYVNLCFCFFLKVRYTWTERLHCTCTKLWRPSLQTGGGDAALNSICVALSVQSMWRDTAHSGQHSHNTQTPYSQSHVPTQLSLILQFSAMFYPAFPTGLFNVPKN